MHPYEILRKAKQHEATARACGEPSNHDEALGALGLLLAETVNALNEVAALKGHACCWGDNDYCSICGADGRG